MIVFEVQAWEQYIYWQEHNKQILSKINQLIKECHRQPFQGTGKPEALKGSYKGCWSRRIDKEHRLVYKFENGMLIITECRYHYND